MPAAFLRTSFAPAISMPLALTLLNVSEKRVGVLLVVGVDGVEDVEDVVVVLYLFSNETVCDRVVLLRTAITPFFIFKVTLD